MHQYPAQVPACGRRDCGKVKQQRGVVLLLKLGTGEEARCWHSCWTENLLCQHIAIFPVWQQLGHLHAIPPCPATSSTWCVGVLRLGPPHPDFSPTVCRVTHSILPALAQKNSVLGQTRNVPASSYLPLIIIWVSVENSFHHGTICKTFHVLSHRSPHDPALTFQKHWALPAHCLHGCCFISWTRL